MSSFYSSSFIIAAELWVWKEF